MSKEHEYKEYIITNVPYRSEPRWFVSNKDQTENKEYIFKYPKSTLKEAKNAIDIFVKQIEALQAENVDLKAQQVK